MSSKLYVKINIYNLQTISRNFLPEYPCTRMTIYREIIAAGAILPVFAPEEAENEKKITLPINFLYAK